MQLIFKRSYTKLQKISFLKSPFHFVKIRLSNFLGNEFLVKMFKL